MQWSKYGYFVSKSSVLRIYATVHVSQSCRAFLSWARGPLLSTKMTFVFNQRSFPDYIWWLVQVYFSCLANKCSAVLASQESAIEASTKCYTFRLLRDYYFYLLKYKWNTGFKKPKLLAIKQEFRARWRHRGGRERLQHCCSTQFISHGNLSSLKRQVNHSGVVKLLSCLSFCPFL